MASNRTRRDRRWRSKGGHCPKGHGLMERFEKSEAWKPKPNKPYWYSYWDVCSKCGHVQHYEQAKVFPNGRPGFWKPNLPGEKRAGTRENPIISGGGDGWHVERYTDEAGKEHVWTIPDGQSIPWDE